MCQIAKQLLAEKLIDDFYEEYARDGEKVLSTQQDLADRLKACLSTDQHEWLYRWEAECVETCGHELRQFADFVADILLATQPHADGAGRDV